MIRCPMCDEEIDEDDVEFDCPFCSNMDMGEGFYRCENCETLFDYNGELWVCHYCHNHGMHRFEPSYDDEDYCEDENPDVNQGWVGEHYG
ncbi:hypothetical protein [Methanobrevibacter millerae]|uniref:Uncharacterized protein n=1 Tax=Methanobrevibacter millerae TaxID=230361 RepID=A0A1G5VJT3_9EURY|nr:hypothetical protein [Methanobrevibacter millerae]SDA46080.1 hypothetical protein SAMN02910315_00682 [Methanobrevibacter millerae]